MKPPKVTLADPSRPRAAEVWQGLSVAEFKRAGVYIRDIANRLGLNEWRFELLEMYADEDHDCTAEVRIFDTKSLAQIKLGRGWADESPDAKRSNVVHELLHAHLRDLRGIVHRLENILGREGFRLTDDSFSAAEELLVDRLTDAIALLMPPYPATRLRARPATP